MGLTDPNPSKWQRVLDRLEQQRQKASDLAIQNHSHWEDRSQGIVAGLILALAIVREEATPCPVCGGRGEVPATPGQPGDGPMPCPRCSMPRPDYDPRLDWPERYKDGPI